MTAAATLGLVDDLGLRLKLSNSNFSIHALQTLLDEAFASIDQTGVKTLLASGAPLPSPAPYVREDVVFDLIGDALDGRPIKECSEVWDLVEARSASLAKLMSWSNRAKLAALRVSNELLRRLSTSQHPVLCGRIMMLLAVSNSLSEKSGVNINGTVNEDNEAIIEPKELYAKRATEGMEKIPEYAVYERFWGLQRFLKRRALKDSGALSSSASWKLFQTQADTVMDAFEGAPLQNLSFKEDVNKPSHAKLREARVSVKYLTSGALFRSQILGDSECRRNVCTQLLFFSRQLIVSTEDESFASQVANWASAALVLDVARKIRQRSIALLESCPPNGKEYTSSLLSVLAREAQWEAWKAEKCPNFEKPRASLKAPRAVPTAYDAIPFVARHCLIASEVNPLGDTPVKLPTLEEASKTMLEALDPENMIEDEYHPRLEGPVCWRGLRVAARSKLSALAGFPSGSFERTVAVAYGVEIPAHLKTALNPLSVVEESKAESRATTPPSAATPVVDASPSPGESEEQAPAASPSESAIVEEGELSSPAEELDETAMETTPSPQEEEPAASEDVTVVVSKEDEGESAAPVTRAHKRARVQEDEEEEEESVVQNSATTKEVGEVEAMEEEDDL